MKKLVASLISVAAISAAVLTTGCENGMTKAPNLPATFAGEYQMSATPFYSSMNAKNPSSTAFTLGNETMTYAQVIMAANSYLPSVEMSNSTITFNADGTIKIVEFVDQQEQTVFPLNEKGLTASDITYALDGDNMMLELSSDAVELALNSVLFGDQESIPQMKTALKGFTKGALVYDGDNNTAKIVCRYKLSGNSLYLYLDKELLADTWICAEPVADKVLPLFVDQEDMAMVNSVAAQVSAFINGFSRIEIGMGLTRK